MDKKKITKIAIRGLIGVVLILLAFFISKKMIKEREKRQQILELPEMKLNEIDGDSIALTPTDTRNKILIINYFNTHCDFCLHEIKDFREHVHLFPKTQIMLISAQEADTLRQFRKSSSLDSISHMKVYQCKYMKFTEHFGDVVPPTTFVYDSNRRLIKKYKGQIRASVVANDIKNYYKKQNYDSN